MNNPNISRLVLLKTGLENDYKHTLWFGKPEASDTKTKQTNYFLSKKYNNFDFTNLTYIRKDRSVKIPAHYDSVVGANYVMYQNNSDTKWYYAFIVDIKYISEGVTELVLETDCIQTWYFAYKVLPSFVEREHVDNDEVGLHTYPEQVETGDYICVRHSTEKDLDECNVAISFSDNHLKQYDNEGIIYDGIYNPMGFYFYPKDSIESLNQLITKYDEAGKGDAICSVFMVPKFLTEELDGPVCPGPREKPLSKETTVTKLHINHNYTPRNNKLLTFPFTYLLVDNNNGSSVVYKQELFSGEKMTFKLSGAVTPGCSIRLVPTNYNGISENDAEGINLGKYAVCPWINDTYTNWMTQNAVNVGVSYANGIITTGMGAVQAGFSKNPANITGGLAHMTEGLLSIAGTVGQVYAQKMQPDQARGNVNCGDVITGSDKNTFHYYNMTIKSEYARIIDGYFDMFGYKVCRVKTPSTDHRERYWYTKTIDCNIDGGVPQKDLQIIKNAYNNGITFWRHDTNIGLYPYYDNDGLKETNFVKQN